eukprot:2230269-Amphidinium_carterae.1
MLRNGVEHNGFRILLCRCVSNILVRWYLRKWTVSTHQNTRSKLVEKCWKLGSNCARLVLFAVTLIIGYVPDPLEMSWPIAQAC